MHRIFLVVFAAQFALGCAPDGSVPLNTAGVPERVQRAVDLGRVAPDTEFDFVIGLSLHDRPRLRKLVVERAPGEEGLLPDAFADRFAPSPAQYARLVTWLRAHGIEVRWTARGRTTISAHGTAAAIERLFSVQLHEFTDAAGPFRAAAGPIGLSAELVDIVSGVVGLSGTGGWRSHLAWPALTPASRLTPTDLHDLYGTAAIATPGQGETVAILGAGRPPDADSDVGLFMRDFMPYGLTSVSGYQQVLVGGPNRDDDSLADSEYVENVLDAEMVLAMAPYATVVHVLTATNTPGLFADGISYIVNQVPQAHAVSVSYGTCERGAASEMPVVEALLEQADAEGQTWFFASGDSGTDGCRDGIGNHHISAGWPASSPHAVGVGGTMIGGDGLEVVWNENSNGRGAGGGGPSETFVKPAYQVGVTADDGARDTPDVAAIAGGGGVWIAVQDRHLGVNGTSVAAPIWAGAWALVDQAKGGNGIRGALAKIYAVGRTAAFHDITIGDNGGPDNMSAGYPAANGYDLATGWGSPDVPQLVAHLP
jgi:kumamolisin